MKNNTPYVPDFNDKIEITKDQSNKLMDLVWSDYVISMSKDEFLKRQSEIVPNSFNYTYLIFPNCMVRNIPI
jgi:hypothetical protein